MNGYDQFIPVDKSWLTRVGALDIINGYTDIDSVLDGLINSSDDIEALRSASKNWRNNEDVDVGESATLYRFLQFTSWKNNLHKKFLKHGSLLKRDVCSDDTIVQLDQVELLKLDNSTTQWASAAVISGDGERLANAPLKLRETYEAVDHWTSKRKNGAVWESRPDITIKRQADTFVSLLMGENISYFPECSDDFCFARAFNYVTTDQGKISWPSLAGHESNRFTEMEKAIAEVESGCIVSSKDHRVIQALAMWCAVNNKVSNFLHPDSVNKSWPDFWKFLDFAVKNYKQSINSVNEVLSMIEKEIEIERNTITLIPSENIMSSLASSVYSLNSNNRYLLKLRFKDGDYMPGRENLGNLFKELDTRIRHAYNAEYVVTKGFSGIHNMDIIFSALRKDFAKAIIVDTVSGGHSKTRGVALKHGFDVDTINTEFENWDLDYSDLDLKLAKWKDQKVFVYLDHTVCVNPVDIGKLMKKVPETWLVYYDISHLQLFYFCGLFSFPKVPNFFYGGSTHKTFPGPQKSIVLINDKVLYELIDSEFTKNTSSIHTGSLLALLVTVLEMERFGTIYASDILKKTKLFASCLKNDFDLVGPLPDYTNTHQVCIDIDNIEIVTKKLAEIGIITTPMRIPSRKRSGLRFGVQELCRLGVTDGQIKEIASIIVRLLKKIRMLEY